MRKTSTFFKKITNQTGLAALGRPMNLSIDRTNTHSLKDEKIDAKREMIDLSGYVRTKNGLLQKITVESVKKRVNIDSDKSEKKTPSP